MTPKRRPPQTLVTVRQGRQVKVSEMFSFFMTRHV